MTSADYEYDGEMSDDPERDIEQAEYDHWAATDEAAILHAAEAAMLAESLPPYGDDDYPF